MTLSCCFFFPPFPKKPLPESPGRLAPFRGRAERAVPFRGREDVNLSMQILHTDAMVEESALAEIQLPQSFAGLL